MEIGLIERNGFRIAELISTDFVIQNIEDGIDLVGNLYYQGFDKVLIYEQNIVAEFFDLKTGMAGEILQKFTNYKLHLVIIGNFRKYESTSLQDFIFECNKGLQVNFISTKDEALVRFLN